MKPAALDVCRGWADYDELLVSPHGNGPILRKELAIFKGLEEVLLSHAPEEVSN
ncbi:hypothetical protein M7I_4353 [Glarea lozoyensis 74030]|uniref:Uncharacterized protein n=1 Tax=Glarea lozoyensis (strain ATCC 74030 / MF5533) TaxID=1104152 RepID=H0ENY8_GLAL7|nr:hypothetical protein M7I_4353 [Glarea lozoyensis 74030]